MSQPSNQSHATSALITGGIILGACAGAGIYLLQTTFGGTSTEQVQSWIGEKTPAPVVNTSTSTTQTLPPPKSRGVRRMPDVTLTTVDGDDVKLYTNGVAPAVVTEFLIGCADCKTKFAYFPRLVDQIAAAEEDVVNVAYMGRAHQIRRAFADIDFGGPVHIDKGSQLQRHFGIGTFTVWLLDRRGEILFQGTPQGAEEHLDEVFALRARQARGGA